MPATATRQKIIEAAKTRMALINGAGGYYTTIGAKVTEGKENPFGANRVDGLDISDFELEEEEVDVEDESLVLHRLPILFKGIAKSPVSPEKGRQIIFDIDKAIFVDETWGGLAEKTVPAGSGMELDQDEVKVIGVNRRVIVEYRTGKFQES